MFKTTLRYSAVLYCGIIALFLFLGTSLLQNPTAFAQTPTPSANASLSLSVPGSPQALGHPKSSVQIAGNGFTPNSQVSLYTTPDSGQCQAGGQLTQFTTHPIVDVDGQGIFNVPTRWPDNASTPGTAYYVCALSSTVQGERAVTGQTFTVAQPLSATPSQDTANPGDQVTVTGANWVPQQQVEVSLISPANPDQPVATQMTSSDAQGNFTVTLQISESAPAGQFAIRVVFANDPEGPQYQNDGAVTINSAVTPTPGLTPTPSPTTTPQATPSPNATPTPPPSNSDNTNTGGPSGTTILIFALGGIGVLLVVVGLVMLAASSPSQARQDS